MHEWPTTRNPMKLWNIHVTYGIPHQNNCNQNVNQTKEHIVIKCGGCYWSAFIFPVSMFKLYKSSSYARTLNGEKKSAMATSSSSYISIIKGQFSTCKFGRHIIFPERSWSKTKSFSVQPWCDGIYIIYDNG